MKKQPPYEKQIQELSDRIDFIASVINSHNAVLEILIKNLTKKTAKNENEGRRKK